LCTEANETKIDSDDKMIDVGRWTPKANVNAIPDKLGAVLSLRIGRAPPGGGTPACAINQSIFIGAPLRVPCGGIKNGNGRGSVMSVVRRGSGIINNHTKANK